MSFSKPIEVLARKRPLLPHEQEEADIIALPTSSQAIVLEQKKNLDLSPCTQEFSFLLDGVIDQFTTNQQLYQEHVNGLISEAFKGNKVGCFAYGQTGSGKTHTIFGDGQQVQGLYQLSAVDIFHRTKTNPNIEVYVSFFEIYREKAFDLINQKRELQLREDEANNIHVAGLSEVRVDNARTMIKVIEYGMSFRIVAQNSSNDQSSRSHAVLQISLKEKDQVFGKIAFIDLAGSERGADHPNKVDKVTLADGAGINSSLLALKECIRAIYHKKPHIPFRGSKLTRILKEFLVGDFRVVMIATVSPAQRNCRATINTLQYARRIKEPLVRNSVEKIRPGNFTPKKRNQAQQPAKWGDNLVTQRSKSLLNQQSQLSPHQKHELYAGRSKDNINIKPEKLVQIIRQGEDNNYQAPKPFAKRNEEEQTNRRNNLGIKQKETKKAFNERRKLKSIYKQNQPPKPKQKQQFAEDISGVYAKQNDNIKHCLREEQKLMKEHDAHLQRQNELTQGQIQLKRDLEKDGSNMQNYLQKMEGLLQEKIASIQLFQRQCARFKNTNEEFNNLEQKQNHANLSFGKKFQEFRHYR